MPTEKKKREISLGHVVRIVKTKKMVNLIDIYTFYCGGFMLCIRYFTIGNYLITKYEYIYIYQRIIV